MSLSGETIVHPDPGYPLTPLPDTVIPGPGYYDLIPLQSHSYNTVTVDGAQSDKQLYDVSGGYNANGDVTGNTVNIIKDGEVHGMLAGGETGEGDAIGNTVNISEGAYVRGDVWGGSAGGLNFGFGNWQGSKATGNSVTISDGGTVEWNVYGGYGDISDGNTVTIDGGIVRGNVHGGGGVNDNSVSSNNTVIITSRGGTVDGIIGGSAINVIKNRVEINGGTVNGDVSGGEGRSGGSAEGNIVTINDGAINFDLVSGGAIRPSPSPFNPETAEVALSGHGTAKNNEVHVNGGKVKGIALFGGGMANKYASFGDGTGTPALVEISLNGDIENNSVSITGGEVNSSVFGGVIGSVVYEGPPLPAPPALPDLGGTIAHNTVAISGGSVDGDIFGGFIGGWGGGGLHIFEVQDNPVVMSNTVVINGGTVNGEVNGGMSAVFADGGGVNNNTVAIYGDAKVFGAVTGGEAHGGSVKDNIVTIGGNAKMDDDIVGGRFFSIPFGGRLFSVPPMSAAPEVTGNSVIIGDNAIIAGSVWSAYADYAELDGNVAGNSVSVNGGEVARDVAGAYMSSFSNGNKVANNSVNITDGVMGGSVYGGGMFADNIIRNIVDDTVLPIGEVGVGGDVTANSVTIAGGEITKPNHSTSVTGGVLTNQIIRKEATSSPFSVNLSGNVTKNSVTINDGIIHTAVAGGMMGYNEGTENEEGVDVSLVSLNLNGNVADNLVTINGGTVNGNIYGGALGSFIDVETSGAGNATGNTVTINGGTMNGSAYGGYAGSIDSSRAYDIGDVFSGNTLNMNSAAKLQGAYNFEFVNFGYNGDANIDVLDTTPTGDAAQKAVKLNTGGHDVNFTGQIIGSGSLIKNGAGGLTLNGSHSIGGRLIVDQGSLAFASGFSATAGGGVAISQAGTLELKGSASVDVGGGGATFATGSQFTPNGNTLDVTGSVDIRTGAILNLGASDVAKTILTGTNGISGSFNSLLYATELLNDNTALKVAGINSSGVILDSLTNAGVMAGPSAANGLELISSIVGNPAANDSLRLNLNAGMQKIADLIAEDDADTASIALAQVLGQNSVQAIEMSQTVAQSFANAIFSRLSHLRDFRVAMEATPVQSGDALAAISANGYDENPANRIWAGGFGTFARQRNHDGEFGYKYDSGGFVLGYDRRFGQNLTAGFTGAYSRGRLEGNEGYSNTDIDTMNFGLYASYDPQCGFYAEGSAGFGYTWNQEHEDLIAGGYRDGKYRTHTFQAGGNIGYAFMLPSAFRVIPTVGVQFIHARQKGAAQTGTGLLMWRDSSDNNYLEVPFAMRVNKTFNLDNGVSITPEVRAAWIYEAKKDRPGVRAGYVGSSDSAMLFGTNPGKNRGLIGAGVKARFNRTVDAFIDYNLELRNKYQNHNVIAGIGISF